ncbi:MAG: hypothetical protein IKN72_03930 [Clostridia bacterium]|nr:hypothetical protein [Clostridia bacterium]
MKQFTKSLVSWVCILLLLFFCFSACQNNAENETTTTIPQTTEAPKENNTSGPYARIPVGEPKVRENPKQLAKEHNMSVQDWLLFRLNEKLSKRNFPELANTFFLDSFSLLYETYESWQIIYKDLPDIADYIQENLIDVIDQIKKIEMIDKDSKEGKRVLEEVDALAFTSNHSITVLYKDPEIANEKEHTEDLELFLHECAHCSNPQLINQRYYCNNATINDWFVEGEATYHSKFINPLMTEYSACWSIVSEDGTKQIEYKKETGIGYLVNLYAYENLAFLAGYDAMHAVGRYADLYYVLDTIAENYGAELEKQIWNTLCKWYNSYKANYQSDKSFQLAVDLQNLLLECIKQDILALDANNPEQVKKYMEVYRGYKLKIMPQILDEDQKLYTNQYFHVDELDELLIDKIEQSGAMQFSEDSKMNRLALKAVLYADNQWHVRDDNIISAYLPPNIKDTEYTFVPQDEKHNQRMCMYMKGGKPNPEFSETDEIYIILDETGIKEIGV